MPVCKIERVICSSLLSLMVAAPVFAQSNQVTTIINAVVPTNTSLVATSGGGNTINITIPANSSLWQYDTMTGNIYTSGPVTTSLTGSTNKGNGMSINVRSTAGPTVSGGDSSIISKFRIRLINATAISSPANWTFTPTNYSLDQITSSNQILGQANKHGSFNVDFAIDVPSTNPINPTMASAGATVSATLVLTGQPN